MAKILFISKYIRTIEEGTPTRHYFFCRNFATGGNEVKVVKSRASFASKIPAFNHHFKTESEGLLELITINGPMINRGFSLKRLVTWFTFEFGVVRYMKSLKKYKPDIIVVSSLSIFTFLTGIWLKKKYKVPLIVEVRDIYPLTLTEVGGYSRYNPLILLMGYIEKLGYLNADYIVSSLDNLDVHVRQVISKSFRFKWIPTGFENTLYKTLPDEEYTDDIKAIQTLKSEGNFLIGYAGTIGLANALDVIFNAAKILMNSHPNIKFVFIGGGPLKNQYVEQFRDSSNIYFVDFVNKQYLPDVLSNIDVLINTWKKSKMYAYGISPNKWNEYMYAGRPFILSHDFESKIFNEAKCGWQIKTDDVDALVEKIVEVSNVEKVELDRIGSNGKEYLLDKLSYSYLSKIYEETMFSSMVAKNK